MSSCFHISSTQPAAGQMLTENFSEKAKTITQQGNLQKGRIAITYFNIVIMCDHTTQNEI